MSRINSNIPSLIAQSHLSKNNKELQLRLERLSTGLRINRGADDPAGLIITERIRSDLNGIEQAIKNVERASSVIATTEGALAEVNDLLTSIRALMVEAANTGANSKEERAANQLQIDSAIDSITRISNTATFGGLKLLNGSLDYTLSGINTAEISQARINSASLIDVDSLEIEVNVLASAQVGALYYPGQSSDPTHLGEILSTTVLEVTGPNGVEVLTFASYTPLSDVVAGINKLTSITGVEAELINSDVNSGIVFQSADYGSGSFVSVKRLNAPSSGDTWATYRFPDEAEVPDTTGGFPWGSVTSAQRDAGRNVSALVNGNLATGDGLEVSVNSQSLAVELLLAEAFATDPDGANSTFHITGGGALFQVGPEITPLQQLGTGIPSVAASNLGGVLDDGTLHFLSSIKSGGENSIENSVDRGDFTLSSKVVQSAIDQVTILRGRLGALERNSLETNIRSMQAAYENLSASNSRIRDADFAFETSKLTRAQILASSGTSILALANQQSQQVLQLLG
ncbi:MAG TPA: flagellin [Phycisphaerales bacterium]|nr:flagellin [Phycisphaerales bacterium]